MPGIACEEPVRFSCEPLNVRWQFAVGSPETGRCTRFHSLAGSSCVALPALISSRASSASLLRASWELEKTSVQRSSSRSSSRSHCAIRSCSSGGSADIFSIAVSKARLTIRIICGLIQAPNPTQAHCQAIHFSVSMKRMGTKKGCWKCETAICCVLAWVR